MIKLTRTTDKAWFLKDTETGDKYKVENSMAPFIYVNGKQSYQLDYTGIIYAPRVWHEDQGAWFYPHADDQGCALVIALYEIINKP